MGGTVNMWVEGVRLPLSALFLGTLSPVVGLLPLRQKGPDHSFAQLATFITDMYQSLLAFGVWMNLVTGRLCRRRLVTIETIRMIKTWCYDFLQSRSS